MTMGPNILGNPYHISVTRVGMTKNLDARFDEVRDEIVRTFEDHLALEGDGEFRFDSIRSLDLLSTEWKAIPAQATVMQVICRTSNRLFVGLPLCESVHFTSSELGLLISKFRPQP